ncbi:MAG: hypothetical protein GXP09_11935 [Gammaproteobacteria bacterium]|nr:hypothetical protein [Gammaproteobacteria bacterium]
MTYETIQVSREELYDQVWSEPMTKLAERYGLSDVGLAKICRRLNVPRPGRGYWAKKRRGRAGRRPPLPSLKDGQESEAMITKREKPAVDTQQSSEAEMLIASEMCDEKRIHVPAQPDTLHPLVARTEKGLGSAKLNNRHLLDPRAKQCLNVQVGAESVDRAVRIMDALLKALDARGFTVAVRTDPERSTTVSVLGETLEFSLEESVMRKEHVLTPVEQKKKERDRWYSFRIPQYDFVPAGKLSLKIRNLWLRDIRMTWSDGNIQRVEDCLNAFIIGLIKASVQKRADRMEREAEQRRREEKARLIREEKERLKKLETNAKNWHKSQTIRAYIEAVRGDTIGKHGKVDGEFERWLTWASQQADRLDPLTESPASILDEEDDHRFW